MAHPKSQHFVPKSYLHGFSRGAGRKARVYVYERNGLKPFRQNPKNVAHRTHYYSYKAADGNLNHSVESVLSQIESDVIPILRGVAQSDLQLTWDQRSRVALFVAFQELRVPWYRCHVEMVEGKLVDHVMKFAATVPGHFERILGELEQKGEIQKGVTAEGLRQFLQKGEYKIKVDPLASLQVMLSEAPALGQYYVEMMWRILRAPESLHFYTSDNPVMKYDPTFHDGSSYNIGFSNPALEVVFPITQTTCLFMTQDRSRMDKWFTLLQQRKTKEARMLRQSIPTTEYLSVDPVVVQRINLRTIAFAERYVFSPMKDDLISKLLQGECQAPRINVG